MIYLTKPTTNHPKTSAKYMMYGVVDIGFTRPAETEVGEYLASCLGLDTGTHDT